MSEFNEFKPRLKSQKPVSIERQLKSWKIEYNFKGNQPNLSPGLNLSRGLNSLNPASVLLNEMKWSLMCLHQSTLNALTSSSSCPCWCWRPPSWYPPSSPPPGSPSCSTQPSCPGHTSRLSPGGKWKYYYKVGHFSLRVKLSQSFYF